MSKVLIIGATGFVGTEVRRIFLEESDHELTLFARGAKQLTEIYPQRERIVAGDILNKADLDEVVQGQDAVVWTAAGQIDTLTKPVVDAMNEHGIDRLIHLNAMGIYNEVPESVGLQYNLDNWPAIRSSRRAADIVKASPLNFTIIRGAWLDDRQDRKYSLSSENEAFGGISISRSSIADFMLQLVDDEDLFSRTSVGIHRPINK